MAASKNHLGSADLLIGGVAVPGNAILLNGGVEPKK
jgi:hypothetical protein